MEKKDLKSGMVVVTRNGCIGLVLLGTTNGDIIGGCGLHTTTWKPLENLKDNLEGLEECYDIVKIYNANSNCEMGSIDLEKLTLIWSRPLPDIELTMDEIAEKFGIKVDQLKIIKGTK